MSDQSPDLENVPRVDGKNLFNTSGTGITTINGDPTVAQTLNAGPGIAIVDGGGGAHTISALGGGGGLTSINADPTAAQTLAAGANISIVDGGGGLHTIAATIPAALTSINGDATPAQLLQAGANITITDLGGGAHRIASTGPGGGITSINADPTAAQTLLSGTSCLTILNGGGGAHTFSIANFNGVTPGLVPGGSGANANKYLSGAGTWLNLPGVDNAQTTNPGGVALPNGVLTTVATVAAPVTGGFVAIWGTGVHGIAAQIMDVVIEVNGVVQNGTGFSGILESAGQTLSVAGSTFFVATGGQAVAVRINHHGGGAATTSLATSLFIFTI